MSVWDHLDELRVRLLKVVILLGITTSLAFFGADWILKWLLQPFPSVSQTLTSLQPAGVFVQSMRLALIGGFLASLPVVIYQIWSFVSPGLSKKEKSAFLLSLYAGTLLFICGAFFAYFWVIPKALDFFWGYSTGLGVTPSWTIENYLNFVLMFLLSFGLAFELPMVLVLLVYFKILSTKWLSSRRPYIIVFLAIIAAILTPPDVVSLILLFIPLWLLFEISLGFARWIG